MCGKKVGTRRYNVDGTMMNLGLECARFGVPMDAPAPQGSKAAIAQNLEKRQSRMQSRDVFSAQGELVLVEDFGTRIHKARDAKGWTHDQLGDKVRARVPELRQIEAGKMRPSDDLVKRLEKELGITLMERAQADPGLLAGSAKKPGGGSLTIGDILRDALQKK
ncbi:MAG TPA: multiprotein bridging factor aMBF1 [Candidatus Thermoplasmatota archaeon]|nr:multiprotein bridging factor aMBF1 [Candidatus Thermoplasmatota archaeon]